MKHWLSKGRNNTKIRLKTLQNGNGNIKQSFTTHTTFVVSTFRWKQRQVKNQNNSVVKSINKESLFCFSKLCPLKKQQCPLLFEREVKKAYSTWYSQAVSHPSTNQARPCLASEIGRDRACSEWYGRKRKSQIHTDYLYTSKHYQQLSTLCL